MIDKSIEWLQSLYASAGPEADMADDILDLLATAADIVEGRDGQLEEALDNASDAQNAQHDAEYETRQLIAALGADSHSEALDMIAAMREAFEPGE